MKSVLIICYCFSFFKADCQERFSIIINEIMADPSPQVMLPSTEWIELYNRSGAAINIQGWKIGDGSSTSGPLPGFLLKPDSFVIICSASSVAALAVYGTALSVTSFPSLDNDGDLLYLRSAAGKTIHAINFSASWYKNAVKMDGGWTLEMTDTNSPCNGIENWEACTDPKGGTPGKTNSVTRSNPDQTSPLFLKSWANDSLNIILHFSEQVDSTSAAIVNNYALEGIAINSAQPQPPLFNLVKLTLAVPLKKHTIYRITASNIPDCSNNLLSSAQCKTGLASDPLAKECVINEILFNPRTNAYDFIELLNHSEKNFDLSKMFIANRNSNGDIANIKLLSPAPHLIFPGDYIAITENLASLALNYLVKAPENIIPINSLPSYPDDEGCVIILNSTGQVIDELSYKEGWHFRLLTDKEGISLERIDPLAETTNAGTWHSSASTAGFATPGYKNSQQIDQSLEFTEIVITPAVVSPDNDGMDDMATIRYKIEEPGYVANIFIFDLQGRMIRQLVKNSLMGLTGYWTWDGLNDRFAKPRSGIYIIVTEIFNLRGKKKIFKNKIVVSSGI